MAQSDACPIGDQEVAGSIPAGSAKTEYEIFSTVILPPFLLQEGHLSVSREKQCAQVYWLSAKRIKPTQEKCG